MASSSPAPLAVPEREPEEIETVSAPLQRPARPADFVVTVLVASLWVASLSVSNAVVAEESLAATSAKHDATRMYEAFLRNDLHTFARYTYPQLVRLMGGEATLIATLEKGLREMRGQGVSFQSVSVGTVRRIVSAGRELHVVLPITIVMRVPGGELHSQAHLLGISADGGRQWTFIDTARLTSENIRKVLPNYNSELEIPSKVDPKFVPR